MIIKKFASLFIVKGAASVVSNDKWHFPVNKLKPLSDQV